MKICVVLGTRPEIIKTSSVIRLCEKEGLDYYIIHTGQHYSYELDKIFFEELELPLPKYNLDVGSGSHAKQIASILERIEKIFEKDMPDIVLVQGDTNTVLAGALCAVKMGIKVGHIEAGLRSYDRNMPEEINRVVVDHISDYLFCPTEKSKDIALKEGIEKKNILVTGNTIVDAVTQNLELSNKKANILEDLKIKKSQYILLTAHRPANVDNKDNLESLFNGINNAADGLDLKVIFPIHPRTKKMIENFNLSIPNNIQIIDPVGFLEFLQLEANAALIMTDSGGIQEEACILKIPCITLRENTERPETIEVGANLLAGVNPEKIRDAAIEIYKKDKDWKNPFGDGKSGEKIVRFLQNEI